MLEERIFKKKFIYRQKFINSVILRIKYGHRKERTIRGYKMYIFKMMHDVVKKNIFNFINLLSNGTDCREIPSHDDVLAEVYIMFDKCIEKYKVKRGNNFYYYFNKALSRNFFREYRQIQRSTGVELSDAMEVTHPNLHYNHAHYSMDMLLEKLHLSEIECNVIRSRLKGQKVTEFIKENNMTNSQYLKILRKIKKKISLERDKGLW